MLKKFFSLILALAIFATSLVVPSTTVSAISTPVTISATRSQVTVNAYNTITVMWATIGNNSETMDFIIHMPEGAISEDIGCVNGFCDRNYRLINTGSGGISFPFRVRSTTEGDHTIMVDWQENGGSNPQNGQVSVTVTVLPTPGIKVVSTQLDKLVFQKIGGEATEYKITWGEGAGWISKTADAGEEFSFDVPTGTEGWELSTSEGAVEVQDASEVWEKNPGVNGWWRNDAKVEILPDSTWEEVRLSVTNVWNPMKIQVDGGVTKTYQVTNGSVTFSKPGSFKVKPDWAEVTDSSSLWKLFVSTDTWFVHDFLFIYLPIAIR